MRNLLMALLVVGLLAAPSLGVINVKLTADQTSLAAGQSTTVRLWAQGTGAGIYAMGGDIKPAITDAAGQLVSTAASFAFTSDFIPTGLFSPKLGTALANGGWQNFGSQQTTWDTPNSSLGKAAFVEVAHYTVTAQPGLNSVTLTFAGKSVSGYKPLETDKTGVMGTNASVTITPEPVTMALLAIGGLVVARRRR